MKTYLAIKWMDGWVDHSCMYFTPIRFGILSRTNQIAACIYESFLTRKIPSSGDGADFTPSLDSCKHFN